MASPSPRDQAIESIRRVGLVDLRTARAILDALCVARYQTPCPTCGGLGQILVNDPTVIDPFCPDCTDGTRDAGSLLEALARVIPVPEEEPR